MGAANPSATTVTFPRNLPPLAIPNVILVLPCRRGSVENRPVVGTL